MTESTSAGNESAPRPSWFAQLRTWGAIGTQSLGGGASTLYLMRTMLVRRKYWLDDADFLQDWTLSRLSLGNHITALAVLLGRRVGGGPGVVIALGGLLLPSGLITAVLTAGYTLLRQQPGVQEALSGIAPVAIGLMIGVTAVLTRAAMRRSAVAASFDIGLVLLAMTAGFAMPAATIGIIAAGATLGVLFFGRDDEPVQEPSDG